ncbi:MAG TPA: HAD family hydrolase [Verrucomicrobiae bacterium]|jgi:FMN phosphatase YigB (HAD superfamily)
MSLRAVIFDIYNTLLEVLPPDNADEHWARLWRRHFNTPPRLSLKDFSVQADLVVAREHATAKAAGIAFPEVLWPAVMAEVVPELAGLTAPAREDFLYEQTRCWHTVRLMSGAAEVLRELAARPIALGLASNCQSYTLRELEVALALANLKRELFQPELCFFSFAHGFSKPNPHVFRLLAIRARAVGIAPAETLIVGDREDNDIAPARAQGFQTWLLGSSVSPAEGLGGDWHALARLITPGPAII